MRERIALRYPLIVEGKYDKITLSALVSTPIVTLGGYSVFNSSETRALLTRLTKASPVIVLTDSDGAGKLLRAHLSSVLDKSRLIHLYIPKIEGKERRKRAPGKEGLLGVEGMKPDALLALLSPFAVGAEPKAESEPITKADFYLYGLSGGPDAASRRAALALALDLPGDMTANSLLDAANLLLTRSEFFSLTERLFIS